MKLMGSTPNWVFKLKPPSDKIEPPASALLEAEMRVADSLRARSDKPGPISTQAIIADAVARFGLAECEIAWAIYNLGNNALLEVKPPTDWSPRSNTLGCEMRHGRLPDGTIGQLITVELLLEQARILPTTALWAWRRESESRVAATEPALGEPSGHQGTLPVFQKKRVNGESIDPEQIVARARAVRDREEGERRRRQQEAERYRECHQATADYDSSVGLLFRANDPFHRQDPFDAKAHLILIFSCLEKACQLFRSYELDQAWRSVDREATYNHYRPGFSKQDEAKVAFEWACHLLDAGFASELREDRIFTAWENEPLRGSYDMAGMLLRGLNGSQRIVFHETPTKVKTDAEAMPRGAGTGLATTRSKKASLPVGEISGNVEVGIITVRQDEFDAVLRRLKGRSTVRDGRQFYEFSRVKTRNGDVIGVAAVRCLEQGQNVAHSVAQEMIADLNPRWLFLVGIGGGIPNNECSLGDVIVASRLHDFSISAAFEDKASEFSGGGGPMHPDVQNLLSHLPALDANMTKWNKGSILRTKKPRVDIPMELGNQMYYGNDEWRRSVQSTLLANFPPNKNIHPPRCRIAPMISSNTLVKDAALLQQWRNCARHTFAVEMELGGVYQAAHRAAPGRNRIVAIRGISDIVGFVRSAEWTEYACQSAAAFACALMRSDALQMARSHTP